MDAEGSAARAVAPATPSARPIAIAIVAYVVLAVIGVRRNERLPTALFGYWKSWGLTMNRTRFRRLKQQKNRVLPGDPVSTAVRELTIL
jgi:hypothetical protein